MKCILAKRNAGLASDGYKVIHCSGYLKLKSASYHSSSENVASTTFLHKVVGLVAVGHSVPSTAITEIKMSSHTFMFRAGLDLTLIYLDTRVLPITGYEPHHLMDKSYYKFVHPVDTLKLKQDHALLLLKGQAITSYYRFLTRKGGWVWIQSLCIIIHNSRASRQHCILALNHILSEREYSEVMCDREQLQELRNGVSNQNSSVVSAKRSRLSPQSVNCAKSQTYMDPLIMQPSLLNNNEENPPAKMSSNEASTPSAFATFITNKDPQLKSDLLEFDQFVRKYPTEDPASRKLCPTNISPVFTDAYYNRRTPNAFYSMNGSVPFVNSEFNIGNSDVYLESLNNTNIYSKNWKSPVPHKTAVVTSNSHFRTSDFGTPSTYSDSNLPQSDEEIPYFVEYINSNSSNSVQMWKEHSNLPTSASIQCPPSSNGDQICDTSSTSRKAYEVGQHIFAENPRGTQSEHIFTGQYPCKAFDSNEKLPQILLNPLTDQNISLNSGGSPCDIHSPNVYFGDLSNFNPDTKLTSVKSVASRKVSDLLSAPNHLSFSLNKTLESNIHVNVSDFSLGSKFSPLPILTGISVFKDDDNEQSHTFIDSSLDYSSGFCDYVNQCTLSSPASLSDSFCDVKSRRSSDSINEKVDSIEFQPLPYVANKPFYTAL